MFGWSISARRLPLLLEPGQQAAGIDAGADDLERDPALDRLGLVGDVDGAHAALAELLAQLVAAGENAADGGRRRDGT